MAPAIHTARSARSGFPPPDPCPTRVAAALANPQAGNRAKRTTRMATV